MFLRSFHPAFTSRGSFTWSA